MSNLVSLLVGFVFGVGYALLGVKSPAPPIVALFGLLGMVIGEQGIPWARHQYQRLTVEAHSAASTDGNPER